MQIKKEILLFFSLVLLCITLLMAADTFKETPQKCDPAAVPGNNCCKIYKEENADASPWNFITRGILHLIA
jgi:hypothetical protein